MKEIFNSIKAIFIDLDGTLLDDNKKISKYTSEIIEKIIKKKIYVILCSGRANSDMVEKSKMSNCSPIIISSNGAMIYNYKTDDIIYKNTIDLKAAQEIWEFAKKYNINVAYSLTYTRLKNQESNKDATIINSSKELEDDIAQIVVDSNNYKNIKRLQNWISIKYKNLETKNLIKHINENSNSFFYEMDIANKFENKGKAIKKILKYLEIEKEDTICFGDQMGDLSMFNECNIKVAMKNANDNLKKEADYVTEYDNNDDGVAKFLTYYIQQT